MILFSPLHWGQVNRITYPDLVPEILCFTECFVIKILGFVFLKANGRRRYQESVLYTKNGFEEYGDVRFFARDNGSTVIKTVFD
jgi:hypothetical protein